MNDEAKLEIRRREGRKELPQGRVIVFVPLRSFRCRPVFFSSSVHSRFQSVAHNSNPEHNGVSGVQACRVSRNSLKSLFFLTAVRPIFRRAKHHFVRSGTASRESDPFVASRLRMTRQASRLRMTRNGAYFPRAAVMAIVLSMRSPPRC